MGQPQQDFFSPWRGSVQRLPNGNTLICSSERGQVFEVTPDGRVVWEFWNPDLRAVSGDDGRFERRRIYRFQRVAAEWFESPSQATLDSTFGMAPRPAK